MNLGFLTRLLLSLFCFSLFLYSYLDKQNGLTEKRMLIPNLEKEVQAIEEENLRLQYQIDQFENPIHLMQLAQQSEYSHLKHPYLSDIVELPQALALSEPKPVQETPAKAPSARVALATSAP
jgi:hypothetical protein